MKILMIVPRGFPYGVAYSLRARSLAGIFTANGHEVAIICQTLGGIEKDKNQKYTMFESLKVYPLDGSFSGINKLRLPGGYVKKIEEVINEFAPDCVMTSSMSDCFMSIKRIVKKHRIPLLLESCEKFHPSTFNGGRLSPHYIMFLWSWHFGYPKVDGVIAISTFLEQHYKKFTDNVVRIPTILDVDKVPCNLVASCGTEINLLFAGSFAKTKDSLRQYISAVYKMGDEGARFRFNVYGVKEDALIQHVGNDLYNAMKGRIRCYGYVPQTEINSIYQRNDFGVFFRPHIWSSDAGFSTKLGEGMSAGTPFIVNDTSDISMYIKSGESGFVIKDESEAGIITVLKQVLSLSKDERSKMRAAARTVAKEYFDNSKYIDSVNALLERCVNKR